MTSASSNRKPLWSEAVRQGASPTAQSTSAITPQDRVVVADPGLVARDGARGLDLSHQARGGQGMQHVVHGLPGYVGQRKTHGTENRFRVGVWMRIHCFQDGDARSGHAQVGRPELFGVVRYRGHTRQYDSLFWNQSRLWLA